MPFLGGKVLIGSITDMGVENLFSESSVHSYRSKYPNWPERNFLVPMGVLAPGSAHARPSSQPSIDTSGNFLAHMSAESPSNISHNL